MASSCFGCSSSKPQQPPCECRSAGTCSSICCQSIDFQLSVSLHPKATIGPVEVECCGEPTLCLERSCSKDSCTVLITQKACVKIPVSYQISTCTAPETIRCDCCHSSFK